MRGFWSTQGVYSLPRLIVCSAVQSNLAAQPAEEQNSYEYEKDEYVLRFWFHDYAVVLPLCVGVEIRLGRC